MSILISLLSACGGGGGSSSGGSGTTSAPTAPTGVAATPASAQVTVSWNAVSGATSYNLYYSTTAGVTTTNGTKVAGVTSTYVKTGLTDGTAYYFIVTAVNAGGESVASAQVSATPAASAIVPAAPVGVSAMAGNAQNTLAWTPVSGATSYNVYWSTTTGVTAATGTKITGVTNPFTQTGLTNGTVYYYVVTAVNSIGEGAASAQASATPTSTVPAAPTGVTATPASTQNTLSWNAVSSATSYNIYWSTTSGVTPATGTKIAGVTSPYTQTGLTNDTTYYYVVTAVNVNGEGAASTQVSATPAATVTSLTAGQFAKLATGDTWTWASAVTNTPTGGTATTTNFSITASLGTLTTQGVTDTTVRTNIATNTSTTTTTYDSLDASGNWVSISSAGVSSIMLPATLAVGTTWTDGAGTSTTTTYKVTGLNTTHTVNGMTFNDVMTLSETVTTTTSTLSGTEYISMSAGRIIDLQLSGTYSGTTSGTTSVSKVLQPGYIAK